MQTTTTQIDGLKILLAANACLLLTPSESLNSELRAALIRWGMKAEKIYSATTTSEADSILDETKPTICILDFDFDPTGACRLLEHFGEIIPEARRVGLLASRNTSPTYHSDGQVDGYIYVPVDADLVRRNLFKAILAKFYPDSYTQKILNGDDSSLKGEESKATTQYEAAISLNPAPLRAHRGLAFLHLKAGRFELALKHFKLARECAPLDYKTLSGEHEVFLALGDLSSAKNSAKALGDLIPAPTKT